MGSSWDDVEIARSAEADLRLIMNDPDGPEIGELLRALHRQLDFQQAVEMGNNRYRQSLSVDSSEGDWWAEFLHRYGGLNESLLVTRVYELGAAVRRLAR